ncbi:hypothetical protein CNMCM5623_000450 [Aspergillus felis]|uniref:amidase n=1 Tax=Aspergillus felis TaxID=1287682 RepID=A0A8H6Q5W6_9EURO|nr:hypothetical protein CNMCM5623_000450 [Aspergillus felis]KAF7182523.1 hypothetical protein CNMCM7691_002094 [Aspergillus felis]
MASQNSLSDWQHKVAQKQQECLQRIPAEWKIPESLLSSLRLPLAENKNDLIQGDAVRKSGILTERELQITEQYTVSGLLSALAEGRLTSLEVTLAFSKRAAVAQQLVNCLTETMFPEAEERAKYLDDLKAQGKSAGPLHGLPISIKDLFQVKGTHASIGMVSFLDERSTDNSPLVDILLNLGAVIYVKTNIPQTMMTADSHNNVFGRTLNPRNTLLGPGGSSGGEGALIAMRGSPLGVGTDIGGSIRIPALCCGTYGFRPSASRIPNGGGRSSGTPGMKFILSCAGPLALDLDAIEVFLKTVIDAGPGLYDSSVIDVPWRKATVRHPLRIGVVPPDSIFPLHPPVRRTLAEAASLLKAQGHQIIELSAEECKVMEINEVAWNIFTLDSGAMEHLQAAGEPPVPALVHIKRQVEIIQQAGKTFLPDFSHLDRLGKLAALNAKRADLRETWRKVWNSHDLDICLAPPAQNTAVPHDMFGLAPYTTFLNCLDYPSCIIPFGQVNETDAQEAFELAPGQTGPTYNFAQLEGAPCSIQGLDIQPLNLNSRDFKPKVTLSTHTIRYLLPAIQPSRFAPPSKMVALNSTVETQESALFTGAILTTTKSKCGTYHVRQNKQASSLNLFGRPPKNEWASFNTTIGTINVTGTINHLSFDTVMEVSVAGLCIGAFTGNPQSSFKVEVDLECANGELQLTAVGDDIWLKVDMDLVQVGKDKKAERVKLSETVCVKSLPQELCEPWMPMR